MTWTSQHDRIIATRCEGLEVSTDSMDRNWTNKPGMFRRISLCDYSTDLVACVRAAEAWRTSGPFRYYELQSAFDSGAGVVDPMVVIIDNGEPRRRSRKQSPTICSALAWALYEAVRDSE